ncbi:LysR family transcriptional regulator, partial [Ancylobacter sp.]|uniref:LysR family transcriptional regulator n=1 Tax=Ancylobacter sp. TaxID=1872567 RepID=UPI003C7E96F9
MMGRLEEHLGISLFERMPGGVTLTEAGRILYEAISRGFSGIEHALREIEDRKTGVETVTLSVSTGFTTHWIMPHMAEIKRAFPSLELRFQLIMSALSGPVTDVDLGMRFVDGPDERHEASYIMPEILGADLQPGLPRRRAARRDRRRGKPGGDPDRSGRDTAGLVAGVLPRRSGRGDQFDDLLRLCDRRAGGDARPGGGPRLAQRHLSLAADEGVGSRELGVKL